MLRMQRSNEHVEELFFLTPTCHFSIAVDKDAAAVRHGESSASLALHGFVEANAIAAERAKVQRCVHKQLEPC